VVRRFALENIIDAFGDGSLCSLCEVLHGSAAYFDCVNSNSDTSLLLLQLQ